MSHPDLRGRASDIKSYENPGIQTWGTPNSRAGRTWLCSMLGSKWLYLWGMRFQRPSQTHPVNFCPRKTVKIGQVERCVEVFSIRSTVHDCFFFYPSNTQVFRFGVDNSSTFQFGMLTSKPPSRDASNSESKITKQLTITIPGPRKEGVIFLISYPPKNGWPIHPKKGTHPKPAKKSSPLQECCLPPASPSGALECFDALFTRDPFEKMIFDT